MHESDDQTQSEHEPLVGPENEPVWHALELRHQPQLGPVVHEPQLELDAQGSPGAVQLDEYHAHPEPQLPLVGPDAVPCLQELLAPHQPQLARVVQPEHAVASAHGSVVAAVQTPASHDSPEQQSADVTHVCEPVRQAQRPLAQSIWPQHSPELVHVWPISPQHSDELGLARQLSPLQHPDAAVQLPAAAVHMLVAGRRHVPVAHSSPVAHRSPVVQHIWPSRPHAAAVMQELPLQVPAHAAPQAPQLRVSVRVSAHVPLQHIRPVPVHMLPAQHGWPEPPQVPATVVHMAPMQTRPAPQRSPAQQGSRAPPHAAAVAHVPDVQVRPEEQLIVSQQGCRSPPHAAGIVHAPRAHTRPAPHVSPAQHGWVASPHAAATEHMPAWHTRPRVHAPPAQHGCVSRPQADAAVQLPAEHVRPALQVVPRQHVWRSSPQSVGIIVPPSGRTPPPS